MEDDEERISSGQIISHTSGSCSSTDFKPLADETQGAVPSTREAQISHWRSHMLYVSHLDEMLHMSEAQTTKVTKSTIAASSLLISCKMQKHVSAEQDTLYHMYIKTKTFYFSPLCLEQSKM